MSSGEPTLYDLDNPLVSVLVYNYNYGRFLKECLESIVNQTYPNIEIVFSDNASTDESWDIALAFIKQYPGCMTITRNRENFGSDANFRNCVSNLRGKYFINMCSDDMLAPEYVERCVRVMQEHPQLGFVMTHRSIIDKDGQRREEAPFYNQSCVIDGHAQAAVYMMAAVNPSVSQILYDTKKTLDKWVTDILDSRWHGARIMDFNICMEYPIGYIREPLLLNRLHGENDSFSVADNLLEVIGPYILHHQFADKAAIFGVNDVTDRLPASIEKLARLALRYCIRALLNQQVSTAKRYFHLALAMCDELESDTVFQALSRYWQGSEKEKQEILSSLNQTDDLVFRSASYNPPENSQLLSIV